MDHRIIPRFGGRGEYLILKFQDKKYDLIGGVGTNMLDVILDDLKDTDLNYSEEMKVLTSISGSFGLDIDVLIYPNLTLESFKSMDSAGNLVCLNLGEFYSLDENLCSKSVKLVKDGLFF